MHWVSCAGQERAKPPVALRAVAVVDAGREPAAREAPALRVLAALAEGAGRQAARRAGEPRVQDDAFAGRRRAHAGPTRSTSPTTSWPSTCGNEISAVIGLSSRAVEEHLLRVAAADPAEPRAEHQPVVGGERGLGDLAQADRRSRARRRRAASERAEDARRDEARQAVLEDERLHALAPPTEPEPLARNDAAHHLRRAAADRLPQALAPEELDRRIGRERLGRRRGRAPPRRCAARTRCGPPCWRPPRPPRCARSRRPRPRAAPASPPRPPPRRARRAAGARRSRRLALALGASARPPRGRAAGGAAGTARGARPRAPGP